MDRIDIIETCKVLKWSIIDNIIDEYKKCISNLNLYILILELLLGDYVTVFLKVFILIKIYKSYSYSIT